MLDEKERLFLPVLVGSSRRQALCGAVRGFVNSTVVRWSNGRREMWTGGRKGREKNIREKFGGREEEKVDENMEERQEERQREGWKAAGGGKANGNVEGGRKRKEENRQREVRRSAAVDS